MPTLHTGPGAVLFDLDGTLVETAPDLHAVLSEIVADLGIAAPSLPDLRTMIGDGARVLIQRALDAAGHPHDPALIDRLFDRFLQRYTAHPCRHSTLFDGVVPILENLTEAGVALGVCTNKPQAPSVALLEALGIARFFKSVIGGDHLPVRKPDPGHVLAVVRVLGSAPDRAVFVGDSTNDVQAARAAGLKVVVVSFGYTAIAPKDLGADRVIDHFRELPAALEQLTGAWA